MVRVYRDKFVVFFRKLSNHGLVSRVVPGIASALASSDLCVNSGECSVDDCFWSNDISQGISVTPKQKVYLNPFITFPSTCSNIPFKFASNNFELDGGSENFYALVETDLLPLVNTQEQPHAVSLFTSLALRISSMTC